MELLLHWLGLFYWLTFYIVAIWICIIGKKKNPGNGWNLIIIAKIIFILLLFQTFYFRVFIYIYPSAFLLDNVKNMVFLCIGLLSPVGMILYLVGLYSIAKGKKGRRKLGGTKRKKPTAFSGEPEGTPGQGLPSPGRVSGSGLDMGQGS